MRERRARDAGFLLVEALVAFAIVAVMAAMVYTTVAQTGLVATRLVERRGALLLARSLLAGAAVDSRTRPVSYAGADGPYAWTIAVDSYESPEAQASPLRTVTVTVTDPTGRYRLARLSTLGNGH